MRGLATCAKSARCRSLISQLAIRAFSTEPGTSAEDILQELVNYEVQGIPKDAGTTSPNGFDLGRMHRLLGHLGNPHQQWPVVHVAGSKGKGSTVALLSSILQSAGYKVGVYTSPHLQHISERISVTPGSHISLHDFNHLVLEHRGALERCQRAEGGRLSHFEAVTALAFRHFADQKVDIAVVEAGMGGTTDATNVFSPDNLQAAVITALGYEHVEALGGTIESIAAAKSGIMKSGRPVVVSSQEHAPALRVLQEQAHQLACPLILASHQVSVQHQGYHIAESPSSNAIKETITLTTPPAQTATSTSLPSPSSQPPSTPLLHELASLGPLSLGLVGPHQHSNLASALAAVQTLVHSGWSIPAAAVQQGVAAASLPGRFQVLRLPSVGPSGAQFVVLDGAHTAESAAAMAKTLRAVFSEAPVVLVVAMAADKDHRAVLTAARSLAPKAVVFTTVPIAGSYQRAAAPGTLAAQWQAAAMLAQGKSFRCRELIQASLAAAYEKSKHELSAFSAPGVVCITGSLHAVGQAFKIEQIAELVHRAQHHQ